MKRNIFLRGVYFSGVRGLFGGALFNGLLGNALPYVVRQAGEGRFFPPLVNAFQGGVFNAGFFAFGFFGGGLLVMNGFAGGGRLPGLRGL